MKLEIETYLDEQIYYDDVNEKFVCDVQDGWGVKRQSLNDVRAAIKKHFTKNETFTPFPALINNHEHPRTIWIKSIRVDNNLMVSKNEDLSEAYQLSSYDFKYLFEYSTKNLSLVEEIKKANEDFDVVRKAYNEKIADLKSRLTPLDKKTISNHN